MMLIALQISFGISVWTASGSFYWGWATFVGSLMLEHVLKAEEPPCS